RVAAAEWAADALVVLLDQIVDGRAAGILEAELGCQGRDHLAKTLLGGVCRLDLVGNAPEECFVDELTGLEICREYNQLIKRYADFLAVGQTQEVISLFQRNDPAVQELDRLHSLT